MGANECLLFCTKFHRPTHTSFTYDFQIFILCCNSSSRGRNVCLSVGCSCTTSSSSSRSSTCISKIYEADVKHCCFFSCDSSSKFAMLFSLSVGPQWVLRKEYAQLEASSSHSSLSSSSSSHIVSCNSITIRRIVCHLVGLSVHNEFKNKICTV